MKLVRQWRGWRRIERIALWAVFAACAFVATQPFREAFVGWQSQRALDDQWQQALGQKHARAVSVSAHHASHKRKKSLTSAHKAKHPSRVELADSLDDKSEGDTLNSAAETSDSDIIWPLTRLSSSRMKLDAVVVEGTDAAQLKRGPGHEPLTSPPGGPNCVIAAHRNAFGWWFYRLGELRPNDFVVLQVPGEKFIYRVASSRIVSVHDTSILEEPLQGAPRLTLYSCTLPKTEKRLVVVANLANSEAT